MINICIYGVGGVGGYFGAKMLQNNVNNLYSISFIAKGAHLEKIKQDGLKLLYNDNEYIAKPAFAETDIKKIPSPDLIVLCVKSYALGSAMENIKDIITDDTIILPLLNGMDIPDRIRKICTKGIVLPACVYIGTHIDQLGVIRQNGANGKIVFGDDKINGSYGALKTQEVLKNLNIDHVYLSNADAEIWSKYLFIAAYGTVTASTGKTLGEIYENEQLRADVKGIMDEILMLAKRKGVDLDEEAVTTALNKAALFPYETKTSFQRDIEEPGKMNEKELFVDAILNLSDEFHVDVPNMKRYNEILINN